MEYNFIELVKVFGFDKATLTIIVIGAYLVLLVLWKVVKAIFSKDKEEEADESEENSEDEES